MLFNVGELIVCNCIAVSINNWLHDEGIVGKGDTFAVEIIMYVPQK